MLKRLKPYMMPTAITVGAIFYQFFTMLSFLTPYLIFIMLFLTYCKLKFDNIRVTPMHLWLILIQILGSIMVYLVLRPFNAILAQGVMICVLAPTATSAPVITGMLKGNVASLTAYSLISNLSVALIAPVIFSLIGSYNSLPFLDSFMTILRPIFVLLFLPFVLSLLLQRTTPQVAAKIGSFSGLSFYLWSVALGIVTGRTVEFIVKQNGANYSIEILIAIGAFIICASQFLVGRMIGKRYDDTVAGGQGLGQKNTILAIWMAQMYLNPIASIGPGAYVLWQNIINSYQVWLKRKTL